MTKDINMNENGMVNSLTGVDRIAKSKKKRPKKGPKMKTCGPEFEPITKEVIENIIESNLEVRVPVNEYITITNNMRAGKTKSISIEVEYRNDIIGVIREKLKDLNIDNFVKFIDEFISSPFICIDDMVLSYGKPIRHFYQNAIEDILHTIKINNYCYLVIYGQWNDGKYSEYICEVEVDPKKRIGCIITEMEYHMTLSNIIWNFKLKNRRSRIDLLGSTLPKLNSIFIEMFHKYKLDSEPLSSIANSDFITADNVKKYMNRIYDKLTSIIMDEYDVDLSAIDMHELMKHRVYASDYFIESVDFYSLNKEDMLLGIKLNQEFTSEYKYCGPTIFKLETKNIFEADFEVTKESIDTTTIAVKKLLKTLSDDFYLLWFNSRHK